MDFLQKLERRFGRFAIPNLMLYIIILYGAGFVLYMINAEFCVQWLAFSAPLILRGQVWRLVTFLIQPPSTNILYFLIAMYLYYMLGTNLERTWGTFRFNVYFFMGVLGHILAGFLLWFLFRYPIFLTTGFLNLSLFFAFAATYPDLQFMLFFIIPLKAKYLAIIEAVVYLYMIVTSLIAHDWATPILIVLSLLNFLVFFLLTRGYRRISPSRVKQKAVFQAKAEKARREERKIQYGPRHRCAVCGCTEADDPTLEFRYCSKCEGNYEYCQDHLYTHQHVKNSPVDPQVQRNA
ncbi:MAG: hypothetical protein IJL66_00575 [Lachnospiraceae bacterium]|nr:hypothetical protein [Lachnospiraceae bacterium]